MRVELIRAGFAVVACGGIIAGVAFGARQGYPGDHADLALGSAWLASDATGRLTLVNGATGVASAQIAVGPIDTRIGVAQVGATGYASLPTGEVVRVDGANWTTVRADVTAGPTPPELFPSGDLLYAVDADTGELGGFDARTLASRGPTTRLPAPLQPQSVTVDGSGRLWAYDADSGTVLRVEEAVRKDDVKLAPPGIGLLTVADGQPVVVVPGSGQVSLLDADSGSPEKAVAVDLPVDGTVSVAGAADRRQVVLAVGSRGRLVVCDLDTPDGCSTSVPIGAAGDDFAPPVVVADRAYVPDRTTGRVVVVDLNDARVLADPVVVRDARPFELLERDGMVFFNDPESALAGVVESDATVRAIVKYRVVDTSPSATPDATAGATQSPTPPHLPNAMRTSPAGPVIAPVTTATPSAAATGCATWSTVDMPTPDGLVTRFADVSGRWAVGQQGSSQIVERWDGSGWGVVAMPAVAGASALAAVSAPSDGEAWAVGSTTPTDGGAAQPLIEHWDGTAWQVVPGPAVDGAALDGVWSTGTADAWAVGTADGRPLAWHWDGSVWSALPSPEAFGLPALSAVAGTGPDDVWAVGTVGAAPQRRGVLEHWDGTRWQVSATPPGADVSVVSVRALGPGDVWAVGQYTPGAGASQPYALHWDGRSWHGTAFPGMGPGINRLNDVVPMSPQDVWLVGGRGATVLGGSGRPAVEHWDGTAWSSATGGLDGTRGTSLTRAVPLPGGRILAIGTTTTPAGDRPVSATGACRTR